MFSYQQDDSYKIVLKNIKNNEIREMVYPSYFYLMPEDRKKIMRFNFDKSELSEGEYEIRIYAIESFGKESENYLEGKLTI